MISEKAFDVLRTTSLFAGFTDEQLEVVPKVALPREFGSGDTIVAEGATGARSLWLILEGEVEVRVAGKVHRTLGPGEHFGELALLTDARRSADVIARTDTVALELSRRHLEGLIGANPQVAMEMLAELAMRLRTATEALADALSADEGPREPAHLGAIEYAPRGTDDS